MTRTEPITVGVADDQALIRRGIRLLVENEPDLVVVGEAANGLEAIELVRRHHPGVMLIDVHMPEMDGLEATELIATDPELAATGVIVLTTFELDEYVDRALHGGASGFLLKDTEPDLIIQAIRLVANGEALIDPAVTKAMIARFSEASATGVGTIRYSGIPAKSAVSVGAGFWVVLKSFPNTESTRRCSTAQRAVLRA